MTDKEQSEALRLAALLDAEEWPGSMTLVSYARECVAELRRLHAYCQELESQVIRVCKNCGSAKTYFLKMATEAVEFLTFGSW